MSSLKRERLAGIDQKAIRARVIERYMREAGYAQAVCFTCGNAARALRRRGVTLWAVSHRGGEGINEVLAPGEWYTPATVARRFGKTYFDATSGHLPMPLMVEIARELREAVALALDREWLVPTGSGETIVTLRLAFPENRFVPVRLGTPETEYSEHAPLNLVVSPADNGKGEELR